MYSTVLNLLEKDRIPQDLGRWGGRNNLLRDACDDNDGLHPSSSETDPRLKRRKTSTFRGRSFHTASVSLRSYLNHAVGLSLIGHFSSADRFFGSGSYLQNPLLLLRTRDRQKNKKG